MDGSGRCVPSAPPHITPFALESTTGKGLDYPASPTTIAKNLRPERWFLLAGLLILLIWFGLKGWRIASAARSLYARQATAQEILGEGLVNADPEALESLILGLRQDVVILKRETKPFVGLTPLFGWLPKIGPLMASGPQLLEMADAGSEVAAHAFQAFKPVLVAMQANTDSQLLPLIVQATSSGREDLAQASAAMTRLVTAREAIHNVETMPGFVRDLFAKADARLDLAQDALRFAQLLPEVMGSNGTRRYLIIAQNQDELRPSGGFISGAGLLVVENGNIVTLDFQDANFVDKWWELPYDYPPRLLRDYMGLDYFLFRDANFWADFPTSAEQAMALYSYGQASPPMNGAIAFDQQFLAALLAVTGPIHLADSNTTINSGNALETLRAAWGIQEGQTVAEWVPERKNFLGPMAAAIKDRLFTDLGSIDPLFLADTLYAAIQERHLQIYMNDPAVATMLDEIDWDGRIDAPAGHDLLFVADTNIGYNKVNPMIDHALHYQVNLNSDGTATANLELTFANRNQDNGQPCIQSMPYDEAPAYEVLTDGCYWNYVRVYVPAGSNLLQASQHTIPNETMLVDRSWNEPAALIEEPDGLFALANFLLVPRHETITSSYQYQLPVVTQPAGTNQQYTLLLYKQAGLQSMDVTVAVTIPAGTTFQGSIPAPTSQNNQTVIFHTTLQTNTQFIIQFQ